MRWLPALLLLFVLMASTARAEVGTALAPVEQVFDRLASGRAPVVPVRLLSANAESWRARWRIVSRARTSIDWSCFEVTDDVYATSFIGLLARKAREGLTLRVQIDAKGSSRLLRSRVGQRYLGVLASSGKVTIKLFNPLFSSLGKALFDARSAVACNHQKLLIADDEWVVLGGRNTGRKYLGAPADSADVWRDMDVLAGGAAPIAAKAVFERGFGGNASRDFPAGELNREDASELEAATAAMEGAMTGQVVASRAVPEGLAEELATCPSLAGLLGQAEAPQETCPAFLVSKTARVQSRADGLSAHLQELMRAAQQEIIIVSPYVVLSPSARAVLADASGRGVKIVLHTNSPETTNSLMSQVPLSREWTTVLKDNPTLRIFARRGQSMLHAKMYIIDRRVAVIGSYNLDSLSEQVNAEDAIVLRSPVIAAQLAREVGEDLKLTSEYRIRVAADGAVTPIFGPADACSQEIRRTLETYRFLGILRSVL